jgi:hypothetical protein
MKDEIKEILEELNKFPYGKFYGLRQEQVNQINKLLDYITNLQEENRQTKLLKERYQLEKEVYKSRNEKAIEFVEQNLGGIGYVEVSDLLHILQGEDKDE